MNSNTFSQNFRLVSYKQNQSLPFTIKGFKFSKDLFEMDFDLRQVMRIRSFETKSYRHFYTFLKTSDYIRSFSHFEDEISFIDIEWHSNELSHLVQESFKCCRCCEIDIAQEAQNRWPSLTYDTPDSLDNSEYFDRLKSLYHLLALCRTLSFSLCKKHLKYKRFFAKIMAFFYALFKVEPKYFNDCSSKLFSLATEHKSLTILNKALWL